MAEKIDALIQILEEKRRFTLKEVEDIARQICDDRTANYVAIEAISRLARKTRLKIEVK